MQLQTQPLDSLQLALFSALSQNKVGSTACKRMNIFTIFQLELSLPNMVHVCTQTVQSSIAQHSNLGDSVY